MPIPENFRFLSEGDWQRLQRKLGMELPDVAKLAERLESDVAKSPYAYSEKPPARGPEVQLWERVGLFGEREFTLYLLGRVDDTVQSVYRESEKAPLEVREMLNSFDYFRVSRSGDEIQGYSITCFGEFEGLQRLPDQIRGLTGLSARIEHRPTQDPLEETINSLYSKLSLLDRIRDGLRRA